MNQLATLLTGIAVTMTFSTAKAIQFDEIEFNFNPRIPAQATCEAKLVPARHINGTVVPVVNLPMVTIEAENPVPGRYEVTEKGGALLATVNLPQVEITAPYNCARLYPAVASQEGYLAAVTLPEVEIAAYGTLSGKSGDELASADHALDGFWRTASRLPMFGIYILVALMHGSG